MKSILNKLGIIIISLFFFILPIGTVYAENVSVVSNGVLWPQISLESSKDPKSVSLDLHSLKKDILSLDNIIFDKISDFTSNVKEGFFEKRSAASIHKSFLEGYHEIDKGAGDFFDRFILNFHQNLRLVSSGFQDLGKIATGAVTEIFVSDLIKSFSDL